MLFNIKRKKCVVFQFQAKSANLKVGGQCNGRWEVNTVKTLTVGKGGGAWPPPPAPIVAPLLKFLSNDIFFVDTKIVASLNGLLFFRSRLFKVI